MFRVAGAANFSHLRLWANYRTRSGSYPTPTLTSKSLKNQNTIKVMITLGSRKNNRFYSSVGVGAGQNITAPATLLT